MPTKRPSTPPTGDRHARTRIPGTETTVADLTEMFRGTEYFSFGGRDNIW